jgi:phage/plasmid-associated DNA primase
MTVLIRLGDCAMYSKERNLDKPNWHCHDDLKKVLPEDITRELLTDYPYEYYSQKTKLFFDYDEKSQDTTYVTTKRLEIRNRLQEHCRNFTNGFVFTESTSNPNKVSFHVIFRKINIDRTTFIKEDEQELFSKLVGEDNFQHIDHQVYGKKICFRLPYGTVGCAGHSDKHHPHLPVVPQGEILVLSDYVLSLPDTAEVKFYSSQLGRAMQRQLEEDARAYQDDSVDSTERSEKLTRMLGMVKPERFQKYNLWLALMVVMKTHKLSRDLFIKLSQDSGYAYFDESVCIKAWRDCRECESFGIPTVLGWLKQDGVDIRKHFPSQSPLLKELLDGFYAQGQFTDMNVAGALYNHYKDNLFYTSQGWFHYKGKWVLGNSSSIFHPVMKLLTEEALAYIATQYEKLNKEADDYVAKFKVVQSTMKAVNSLQTASKIKSVLETAQGLFHDDKVLDTFDAKPHWFCFDNNKAFNMKANEVVTIVATDRILTTCGYDLPDRLDEDIQVSSDMIHQLTPKENLDSLLSALSLFAYGENINEAFLVFKGEGGNGKGMLCTLLKKVLGGYYYDLPSSILTTASKGDGRASPEMAQCRWARCVMFSEPDAQKLIVKTKINELTGRDTITVRGLFKEPFSYMPKFVLAGLLNDMPRIAGGIADSIKRRTKYIPFPYSFKLKEDYDETNPLHKLADIKMKERVRDDNRFRNGLLWIMLDTWRKNQGTYVSCEADKEEANEQSKANNPILEWLEKYEPSDDFMRIKVLLKEYNDNFNSANNKMTSNEMKRFLVEAKVKIEEDKSHGHKVFIKKTVIF